MTEKVCLEKLAKLCFQTSFCNFLMELLKIFLQIIMIDRRPWVWFWSKISATSTRAWSPISVTSLTTKPMSIFEPQAHVRSKRGLREGLTGGKAFKMRALRWQMQYNIMKILVLYKHWFTKPKAVRYQIYVVYAVYDNTYAQCLWLAPSWRVIFNDGLITSSPKDFVF